MSELEDKLSSILGDPQAMGQIMALARSLEGGASSRQPSGAGEAGQPPPSQQDRAPAPDLSSLLGSLAGGEGGPDPQLLSAVSRIVQSMQADDGNKTALLNALRPYVKEKRYARLDKAVQIARLSRLVRVALDSFRGEDHV